jgi:hopene-associated glycosyltransferase HpnB
MLTLLLAAATFAIWLGLLVGRGGFWLGREGDAGGPPPAAWPVVTAVIPARDEAEGIGTCVASLLGQDYPGRFALVIVDDQSTDGTGAVAQAAAIAAGAPERLTVVAGRALPPGWTGKLWAMKQGIAAAERQEPAYLLLTDADIEYAPDALTRLVARAEKDGLVLNSLMAKLRCDSPAERALVPAFIFFFQMLYPFGWVNRRDRATAAAAGGCMLARRDALAATGGVDSIRTALIDDCALARRLKQRGPIRLGLTERVRSLRPYPRLDDIRRMVARSAYAQLRYSPLLLAGTVAGMLLTYVAPVLLAVFGGGSARLLALAAWAMMAVAFQPTLRLYRASPLWGPLLPAIAFLYTLFTLDSALQHARGAGGMWKGRVQAGLP